MKSKIISTEKNVLSLQKGSRQGFNLDLVLIRLLARNCSRKLNKFPKISRESLKASGCNQNGSVFGYFSTIVFVD